MKAILLNAADKIKRLVKKGLFFLENVWVKRIASVFLVVYSVYYLISQYNPLKEILSSLSPNPVLLGFSSLVLFFSVLFSVHSWRESIAAFGYSFSWIDVGKAQMLSMLGKYIPGHIWNYSSKIYLSHKLGFPIKLSGISVVIEMVITYLVAIGLLLFFLPETVFPIGLGWLISLRILGFVTIIILLFLPLVLKQTFNKKLSLETPNRLVYVVLIRSALWILPSYAFLLLITSLGYPDIGLSTAIAVITSSFFIGFMVIFVPDGLVIREALIIFFLRNILSTPDATIISLMFRFQLLLIELISVVLILLIWKIKNNRTRSRST